MAAKLKDALFLGDFETAQDLEFIVANKITRVINCAGREIPNAWERSGVRYLTFYWPESGNCIIFDDTNTVLDDLYAFIEEALDVGESVLIHSTDGQSRACFCAAVYFMLKYKWTLPKTMEYLQNKRPDLMPRPGFMRQLQALDASLQRVLKAGSKSATDPALRRYSEWDVTVLATLTTTGADPGVEEELLLVNTYLNSQSAPEEVIRAAQSDVPLARPPPPAPLSHPQGMVHFSVGVTTIPGPGGTRPGSAPVVSGRAGGRSVSGPGGGGVTWIDDHRRAGTSHTDVPLSPASRRPTIERPPSASYNSLAVGPGWADAAGGTVPVTMVSPGGTVTTAKVLPTATGVISAAAAHIPATMGASTSPSKIRSILRGGSRWGMQQATTATKATTTAATATSSTAASSSTPVRTATPAGGRPAPAVVAAGGDGSTAKPTMVGGGGASGRPSAAGSGNVDGGRMRMTWGGGGGGGGESVGKEEDEEHDRRVAEEKAARASAASGGVRPGGGGGVMRRDTSGSSVGSGQSMGGGAGAVDGRPYPSTAMSNSVGNGKGPTTAATAVVRGVAPSTLPGERPGGSGPAPGGWSVEGGGDTGLGAAATKSTPARTAVPAPTQPNGTGVAAPGAGGSRPGMPRGVTVFPAASGPVRPTAAGPISLSATMGPVRPSQTALAAPTTGPNQLSMTMGGGMGSLPPGALASLAQGNLSRTLGAFSTSTPASGLGSSFFAPGGGTSDGYGGAGGPNGGTASLASSMGSTSTASPAGQTGVGAPGRAGVPHSTVVPQRSSATRVRGYSPGPGKSRERATAAAAGGAGGAPPGGSGAGMRVLGGGGAPSALPVTTTSRGGVPLGPGEVGASHTGTSMAGSGYGGGVSGVYSSTPLTTSMAAPIRGRAMPAAGATAGALPATGGGHSSSNGMGGGGGGYPMSRPSSATQQPVGLGGLGGGGGVVGTASNMGMGLGRPLGGTTPGPVPVSMPMSGARGTSPGPAAATSTTMAMGNRLLAATMGPSTGGALIGGAQRPSSAGPPRDRASTGGGGSGMPSTSGPTTTGIYTGGGGGIAPTRTAMPSGSGAPGGYMQYGPVVGTSGGRAGQTTFTATAAASMVYGGGRAPSPMLSRPSSGGMPRR